MPHYKAVSVEDPGDTNPRAELTYFDRPQRSCGKVMFSQVSDILFTGGRGSGCVWQTPLGRHLPGRHSPHWANTPRQTPPGQTSPGQTLPPLGKHPVHAGIRWPLQRTLCILLECILVWHIFAESCIKMKNLD